MEEFLNKLSSYEFFVNFVPGCLLSWLLKILYDIEIISQSSDATNVVRQFCAWYLIGLIVNRIGSAVIEPIYKKMGIVEFAPYEAFMQAEEKDKKIALLSEVNNFYRSLISMCVISSVIGGFLHVDKFVGFFANNWQAIMLIALILIFSFSYRFQTNYVRKRVYRYTRNKENNDESNSTKVEN